jgi:hypothetical protein
VKALDGDDMDFVQLTKEGSNMLPDWHTEEDLASRLGQVVTITGRLEVGKQADCVDTEHGAVYLLGKLPYDLDNPSPFGKRITVTGVLRYSPPIGFDKKTAVPGVAPIPGYYYIESAQRQKEKQ